jgi:hypothetical protein
MGMPISAIAFLILTVGIALPWSHYQLLRTDEFYPLETDGVASIARLVHIQLTAPISLDPLVYNIFAHAAMRLFGVGPFAIRLPSICGYLLMQICLFHFVRRITIERAATFALAFPALVGIVMYSVQARPYGLLLGLSALTMVSWQTVTRRESKRTLVLVILSLSVALVINTHYYGVLLLIPLCAAELFRTFERRRVDLPVVFSIGAGMIGILILVPFARAVSEFSAHYFNLKSVSYHFVTHSYIWLIIGYENFRVSTQHLIGFAFAVLLAILIWKFKRSRSAVPILLPRAEIVFLVLLAALPFFSILLTHLVTKIMEEARYILPAIIGITAILAILIASLLQNNKIGRIVLALLFVSIAGIGVVRFRSEKMQAQKIMASLVLSPATQHNLEAAPNQPIYVMNPAVFQVVGYYSPSANIRSRLTLVYSRDNEMLNQHSDHLSLTGANMRADGVRNVVPYESVSIHGTEHLFLLYHNPWDWTDRALAEAHAKITYLGPAFQGDLVSVRFP